LKDDDAATAIRAYTCSRSDFEKWLAEEAAEEAQRLERVEEARQREKMEKREARPAALRKLGSLVSIAKRGNIGSGQIHRRNPYTCKAEPFENISFAKVTPNRGKNGMDLHDEVILLQQHLNPSEPFVLDDQKSPNAGYDEPSPVPAVPSIASRQHRRKTLVPRLAGFFGRSYRSGDSGSDDGSDDGSDKNGVDDTMTTPLHEACRIGCAELVHLMLANGGEPNFKNGRFRTALHTAAGGLNVPEELFLVGSKVEMEQSRNAPESDGIGIRAPVIRNADEIDGNTKRQQPGLSAKKAARAMGRLFKETITSLSPLVKDKVVASQNEAKSPRNIDVDLINRLQTDRMDTCNAILDWFHPDDGTPTAGEGPSINSVDFRGRTALHYAAELGRTNVCLAILLTFGALLTIVDDNARTPCELAAEHSHKALAAQLEARALLFADPYGVEDAMLTAGFENQQDNEESASGGGHTRMTLVPPFSWFETLSKKQVDRERTARIAKIMRALRDAVLDYNEAKDMRELMYSHAPDDDESVDGAKSGKIHEVTMDHKSKNKENWSSSFPLDYENSETEFNIKKLDDDKRVDERPQDLSVQGASQNRSAQALRIESFKETHAEVFLAFHCWNFEKALDAIDDDPARALRDAGIELRTSSSKMLFAEGGRTCLICCDDFADNASKWRNLENCEHGFCVDCLEDYLRDCAVSRSGLLVVCPHHKCSNHLSRNMIEELAPEGVYEALIAAASDHFVAAASDLKFCPHPGCSCVVKRIVPQFVRTAGVEDDVLDYSGAVCIAVRESEPGNAGVPLTYEGVPDSDYSTSACLIAPRKAHRFCFACGEETVHWPVPCEALKAWKKKIDEEVGAVDDGEKTGNGKFDELAQRLWMKANTRPCPKVSSFVQHLVQIELQAHKVMAVLNKVQCTDRKE
jgi:hypothetical protein